MKKPLLALCALFLGLPAAWAQTYPEGSPFAPGTAQQGITGGGDILGLDTVGLTTGDNREGFGGVAGAGVYYSPGPINSYDFGNIRIEFMFSQDYKGGEYSNKGVHAYDIATRYTWDVEWGSHWHPYANGWFSSYAVTPSVVLSSLGCPPGRYQIVSRANSSRYWLEPDSIAIYEGWYSPELYKYRVRVVDETGAPVPNCRVQPVAVTNIATWQAQGFTPPSWRPGVTGSDGIVVLVFPTSDIPSASVEVEAAPGIYHGGVAENPFRPSGIRFDNPMPAMNGIRVVVHPNARPTINGDVVPTPSPAPTPAPATPEGSGNPDFWSYLWVPAPEKLTQFASEIGYWSAWGPFGLVGQVSNVWSTAALAVSESQKWDGLLFNVSGPLGTAYLDLRPELAPNAPDYPTGGRGGPGGSILGVVRVGLGLIVWAGALFGVYRKLRPRFIS